MTSHEVERTWISRGSKIIKILNKINKYCYGWFRGEQVNLNTAIAVALSFVIAILADYMLQMNPP